MTLVTSEELTAYMGGLELNPDQVGVIESIILPGVQQDLENYLNRPVEPVQVRESVRADDSGFLYFRVTPIHKILSVVQSDGSTVGYSPTTPPTMTPVTDDIRTYDEWGDPDLFGYQIEGIPFVGSGFGSIYGYPTYGSRPFYRVEYVAGYNGYVNEALKVDIMRVAAREVEMLFDDTMSLRGGSAEAASNSDQREKGWTQDELVRWDRIRKRVVA